MCAAEGGVCALHGLYRAPGSKGVFCAEHAPPGARNVRMCARAGCATIGNYRAQGVAGLFCRAHR